MKILDYPYHLLISQKIEKYYLASFKLVYGGLLKPLIVN